MKIPDDEEEEELPAGADGSNGEEGMDTEWNRRMKEKLERMRQKKMRDVSITVTQKSGLTGALASRQQRKYDDGEITKGGQGRLREELFQREGTIEFMTGEEDGIVDICVQSIIANRNSPSRVSLRVTMDFTDEIENDNEIESETDGLDHSAVKTQMTRLERDMQTLNNRIRTIMNNADQNKEQELAFHQQSVSMNGAAVYWPIIQLIVIVITGFTQVNHIVRYMKQHHIGL